MRIMPARSRTPVEGAARLATQALSDAAGGRVPAIGWVQDEVDTITCRQVLDGSWW